MQITKFSRRGEYQQSHGIKNCDIMRFRQNDKFAVAVLSDGATKALKAYDGAKTVCDEAAKHLLKYGDFFFAFSGEKSAYFILLQLVYKLKKVSKKAGVDLDEYSSTLLFCLYSKKTDEALLFNLGDGAVFEQKESEKSVKLLLAPKRFENIYPVFVVNYGAHSFAKIKKITVTKNQAIILCSDGVLKAFETEVNENARIDVSAGELKETLTQIENKDDCSFIMMQF